MDGDDNVIVALYVCVTEYVIATEAWDRPFSRHTQVCPTFRYVGAMHLVHVYYQCNQFAFIPRSGSSFLLIKQQLINPIK